MATWKERFFVFELKHHSNIVLSTGSFRQHRQKATSILHEKHILFRTVGDVTCYCDDFGFSIYWNS